MRDQLADELRRILQIAVEHHDVRPLSERESCLQGRELTDIARHADHPDSGVAAALGLVAVPSRLPSSTSSSSKPSLAARAAAQHLVTSSRRCRARCRGDDDAQLDTTILPKLSADKGRATRRYPCRPGGGSLKPLG